MKRFLWEARVYWEDTDAGGVVYYANYLRFLERARTEALRAGGVSQSELAAAHGVLFSVVRVELDYRRPARLDDRLIVSCDIPAVRGVSFDFEQRIWRERADGELLAEGKVRVACLAAASFKPHRLPEVVRRVLNQ